MINKYEATKAASVSSSEPKNSALPDVLEVRLKPANWWGVAVLLAFGIGSVAAITYLTMENRRPNHLLAQIAFGAVIFAFWAAFAGWIALRIVRWRVLVTRESLSYREVRKEHTITWQEVRTYYTVRGKNTTSYVVEDRGGKKITLASGSTHDLLLREIIVERARWADVSAWRPRGSFLRENEVKVFRIRNTRSDFLVALVLGGLIQILCIGLAWSNPRANIWALITTAPPPSWAWLVNPAWMLSGLYTPILLVGVAIHYQTHLFAIHHWQDQVWVSSDRIRWSDGSRSMDVKWPEISRCHCQHSKVFTDIVTATTFETAQGSFTLNFSAFENGGTLGRLIWNYLPEGIEREGEEISLRKRKTTSDGSVVFDYYNGTSRAFLFLAAFMLMLPAIMAWLGRISPLFAPPGGQVSSSDLTWRAVAGAVPLAVCCLGYFRSRVVVRGEFLEHRSFFWTRRVRLKDIEAMKLVSFFFVISTAEKNLVLGCTLSSPDALKKLIREHTGTDLLE